MRPLALALPALLLAFTACEKAPAPRPDDTPPPKAAEPTVATATASAAMTVGPVESAPTPTLAAASASAEPSAKPAAAAVTATPPAVAKGGTASVTGKIFALAIEAPGCRAGADCAMTIKLVPEGAFHVNKEYPYKFVATPHAGVTFLGKTDANQFTKAAGDFVEQGEKSATMTVRYKPEAGKQHVGGTFKLSVCSADQCQIEQAQVDVPVTVL